MEHDGGLDRVMREVAEALDSVTAAGHDRSMAEGRHDDLVPAIGKVVFDGTRPGLSGVHSGRAVSVTLHRGSEMKIIAHCGSPCRFRIVRNTLASRLNTLAGRRVHFGMPMIDTEHLARATGPYDLGGFLQRSDVGAFIDYFRPFYSITGEPGSIHVISDYSSATIRACEVIEKLERTIEFANMLEEEFTDESAVLQMNAHSGDRKEGSGE